MAGFIRISIILETTLCIKITSTKIKAREKTHSKPRLFLRIYLLEGVLITVDKGTNAVGTVVFAIPGDLGKLGNGPQSNESAVDAADASEEPVLRLSGTDGCFLCPPPPPRRLDGDGKALGLKLSSGRLVQSSIDADDDEVDDGGNNAGNAEGC